MLDPDIVDSVDFQIRFKLKLILRTGRNYILYLQLRHLVLWCVV